MKRHFPKEDIKMTDKHLKRPLTSLIIIEMQIKTTMRYHFTASGMDIKITIIKKGNNKCW